MSDTTLAERVARWAESPKGKRELARVIENIRAHAEELREASRIDPRRLDEVITI